MRVLLPAFLLISVFAHSLEGQSQGSVTEDATANSSKLQTYQGCVVRSGGKIMLIDAQNRDYILVSSARPLENYVGQEVQLSAMSIDPKGPRSNEQGINPQQAPGQLLTLDVENLQKVAAKCSSPKTTDKK